MPFLTFKKITSCFLVTALLYFGIFQEAEGRESHANMAETLYQKAQRNYYQLKSSKKQRAYRHQWVVCIKKFVAVYEKYPSSPQAYNALFTVGRLYHQLYGVTKNSDDRGRASHFYYKVISEFKDGRLTDDALFYQGKIYFDKKDYRAALSAFEKILRKYPKGDQAAKAKKLKKATVPFVRARGRVEAKASSVSPLVLIKKVDFSNRPNSTRVVIHTDGPAKMSQNRLNNPERVYFNFLNTRLDEGIKRDIQVGGDILKSLRVSQFDETTSRLVLDIPANKDVKVLTSREDSKIVIDMFTPSKKSSLTEKTKPITLAVKAKPTRNLKAVPVRVAPRSKAVSRSSIPLIVIDPGHGGKDFGAKSSHGLVEKDVTLDISKRLKKILETRYGYSVKLTREDDRFISLEKRGEIANEKDADLFVSIHVNAAKHSSAHGIETFYLGVANNEQAQETAARENGELVYSVKDNQVQQILASLISTTKKNDSAMLAGHVQDRLRRSVTMKYAEVKDRGVKEGPFFVLHDTNMPSVIVEVGFITNSYEERRLRQSNYLDRLASSIARGIHEFKKDRGPTI